MTQAQHRSGRGVDRHVRVLVLTSTFPRWAGDHQPAFVLELCRRLAHSSRVLVLAPHALGAEPREWIDGVEVRRFRYAPARLETLAYEGGMRTRLGASPLRMLLLPLFAGVQIVAIARALRRERVKAIHAHWIVPQGLAAVLARALLRSRVSIVCTSHGGDLYALRGGLWPALKRAVLNRVDAVTVVSAAMGSEVARLAPGRDDVEVAPMGTDLRGRFVPDSAVERAECELLFVGRLVPKKGVDFLLRVLGRLARERGRRPYLRIVGSGPEEDALRRIARDEGLDDRVEFCGFRSHEELPGLYRRCSAAVFPFREDSGGDQEGFGLVVVEALGCACPVLVSELPAVRDVIGDGDHLVALAPGDVEAWGAAIERLLDDPGSAERLGRAGREYVAARFDWAVCAERYTRILGDLIEGGRARKRPPATRAR